MSSLEDWRRALPTPLFKATEMYWNSNDVHACRTWFLRSGEVREKSGKVREFYIPKSGKNKRVKENQSTRVQKLTKMQKKILKCFTQTAYSSSQIFFLLASLADYLYLHFKICSAAFVSSAIASQHFYIGISRAWALEQGEQREQLLPQLLARKSRP